MLGLRYNYLVRTIMNSLMGLQITNKSALRKPMCNGRNLIRVIVDVSCGTNKFPEIKGDVRV